MLPFQLQSSETRTVWLLGRYRWPRRRRRLSRRLVPTLQHTHKFNVYDVMYATIIDHCIDHNYYIYMYIIIYDCVCVCFLIHEMLWTMVDRCAVRRYVLNTDEMGWHRVDTGSVEDGTCQTEIERDGGRERGRERASERASIIAPVMLAAWHALRGTHSEVHPSV